MPRITQLAAYYSPFDLVSIFMKLKSTLDTTATCLLQPLRPRLEVALLTGVYCILYEF